jgi:hypothetical protein
MLRRSKAPKLSCQFQDLDFQPAIRIQNAQREMSTNEVVASGFGKICSRSANLADPDFQLAIDFQDPDFQLAIHEQNPKGKLVIWMSTHKTRR